MVSKIKNIIFFILGVMIFSCNDNSKSFIEFENCINTKITNRINIKSSIYNSINYNKISLSDSISVFENKLIDEGILLGKNQNDYHELIKKLTHNKIELIKEITIKNSGFLNYISNDITTMNFMFDNCPIEAKLSSKIRKKYFEIFKKGYPTKEILYGLIEMNEFQNEVFRNSINYLIFI